MEGLVQQPNKYTRDISRPIQHAWGEWLSGRPWDLFLTLTSEKRSHPEALQKRFRYCTHKIADALYGRSVTRRGESPIEWVNGIERHRSGFPHSHGLLRFPGVDMGDRAQFSLEYWQKWISDTGGWAWLSVPRSQHHTVSYVTKYVVKGGELEFSRNLSPSEDPSPQLICTGRAARRRTARTEEHGPASA
jgi:hypothetical protein